MRPDRDGTTDAGRCQWNAESSGGTAPLACGRLPPVANHTPGPRTRSAKNPNTIQKTGTRFLCVGAACPCGVSLVDGTGGTSDSDWVTLGDGEIDALGDTETDALGEAEGDGDALTDAEGDGEGNGFGVEVLVGVGVGAGAVIVNVADAENPVFLSVNETVTRWAPAPRCPAGGRKPDFCATHVAPDTKAAVPIDTPSHRNVAFVG